MGWQPRACSSPCVLTVTTCWVSIGVDISESTSRGLSCGNRTEEQRPDRRSGVADRVPARPLSGVPIYLQLVHQVDHALRLGYLKPGDQPPKVRDVDALLAINPNTVSRRTAFAELGSTSCRAQGPQIRQLHGHILPEKVDECLFLASGPPSVMESAMHFRATTCWESRET